MTDQKGEILMRSIEKDNQKRVIKSDLLDEGRSYQRHTLDSLYSLGPSIVAGLTANPFPFLYQLYHTVEGFRQGQLHEKTKRKTVMDHPRLGYSAVQLVYKGEKALDFNGFSLRKGDNFIYAVLPRFSNGSEKEGSFEAMVDATDLSIKQIRRFFEDKDYKAVCIGFQTPELSAKFPQEHKISLKSITAEKAVQLQEPESSVLAFTREEFEHLCTTPQDGFSKACEGLADPQFSNLLVKTKTASTHQEVQNYEKLLLERLNSILRQEIDMHFDGSEMTFTREGSYYDPQRRKLSRYTYLKRTMGDFYYVNVTSNTGETRMIPLEELLKTRNQPIEDIINSPSTYKRAQLAFVIHQMIKDYSVEGLTKKENFNYEEVIERLNNLGIVPDINGPYDIITSRKSTAKFGSKKWFAEIAAFEKTELIPMLRTTLTSILIALSTNLALTSGGIERLNEALLKQSTSTIQNFDRPLFSDELPKPGLDWRVEASEGVDASGYYIQSTAHAFQEGKWKVNNNRVKKIELPESLTNQTNVISLTKGVKLNLLGSTTFKIPIKDHSVIGALQILGSRGEKVDYSVWEHDDGTIEVEIPGDAVRIIGYVKIREALLPAREGQVHAVEKINPPLDQRKLNPQVKAEIEKLQLASSQNEFPETIAARLITSHNYSLNPPNKELINQALKAEEYVNSIFEVPGCTCDICNTALAILSTANSEEASFNIAFGYLNTVNGPEGAGNLEYLRREKAHAFGIKEDGKIVDATPGNPADDPMTQQYLRVLNDSHQIYSEDQDWNNGFNDLERNQDLIYKFKSLLAITAAASSFYVAGKVSKVLRRMHPKETASSIAENTLLCVFNDTELRYTFNFMTWLSHGKGEPPNLEAQIKYNGKKNILKAIRENIDYEKIEQYTQEPEKYEANGI